MGFYGPAQLVRNAREHDVEVRRHLLGDFGEQVERREISPVDPEKLGAFIGGAHGLAQGGQGAGRSRAPWQRLAVEAGDLSLDRAGAL